MQGGTDLTYIIKEGKRDKEKISRSCMPTVSIGGKELRRLVRLLVIRQICESGV